VGEFPAAFLPGLAVSLPRASRGSGSFLVGRRRARNRDGRRLLLPTGNASSGRAVHRRRRFVVAFLLPTTRFLVRLTDDSRAGGQVAGARRAALSYGLPDTATWLSCGRRDAMVVSTQLTYDYSGCDVRNGGALLGQRVVVRAPSL
jgi:hypothetical protein